MQISIVQRCCVTDPMKFVPVTIRSTILDCAISQLRNFLLSLEYIYTSFVYSSFHALECVRCEVRRGDRTKLTRARCAANHDNRATTLRTMSPAADVDDPRPSVSGRRGRRQGLREEVEEEVLPRRPDGAVGRKQDGVVGPERCV